MMSYALRPPEGSPEKDGPIECGGAKQLEAPFQFMPSVSTAEREVQGKKRSQR